MAVTDLVTSARKPPKRSGYTLLSSGDFEGSMAGLFRDDRVSLRNYTEGGAPTVIRGGFRQVWKGTRVTWSDAAKRNNRQFFDAYVDVEIYAEKSGKHGAKLLYAVYLDDKRTTVVNNGYASLVRTPKHPRKRRK